ncbi:MAG: hypothetical protein ACOC32_02085 [Nanoarchaeota archaeon]
MKHNLRNHEIAGLALIFIGGTSIGIGLYYIVSSAFRSHLVTGKEMLIFPALFGLGILLFELGKIELKEIPPGKHR